MPIDRETSMSAEIGIHEATSTHKSAAGSPQGTGQSTTAKNYESAVAKGFYYRDSGGLEGKYDNVRRCWEDQITRYNLQEFVGSLVARKRRSLSRIRVLDLGCGSGEGYEMLTGLKKGSDNLASKEVDVLPADILGCYKGIDISHSMVSLGKKIYEGDPKVDFEVGDLSQGLGPVKDDRPFDIYFSTYGSLSHLHDPDLSRLIGEIFDHCHESCVIVADLLGRDSFEWQTYWNTSGSSDETTMRPYSLSYLYPPEVRDKSDVECFPMRYWGGEEFDTFVTQIIEARGGRIAKKQIRDRSVLVGRHMDTREFNPQAQPIRAAINNLHEFNQRTDLRTLVFDYTPSAGHDDLNEFFEKIQMAWNAVVYAAIEALEHWNDPDWLNQPPSDQYPALVQEAIRTIRNVVRNIQWFRMGDPRANVVEPQLGYVLRNLEMDMQQGMGAGHGLQAIYEIQKS